MHTTLNEINKHHPCLSGWTKLLTGLKKFKPDDAPLGLETILAINGIEDAIWALRCFDYREYCLFLADVAALSLPKFEELYPEDDRPRKAIEAIRDYHAGEITRDQLTIAAAAVAPYAMAASAAAYSDAAAYTAYAVACTADAVGWSGVESLFIKHFGDKTND